MINWAAQKSLQARSPNDGSLEEMVGSEAWYDSNADEHGDYVNSVDWYGGESHYGTDQSPPCEQPCCDTRTPKEK